MAVQESVKRVTEAALMALGSDARVEVVDGEFVRKGLLPKDWNIDCSFPGVPMLAANFTLPSFDQ